MKQVNKVIKNGVTYYFADSALTQSVDTIVDTLNHLAIPDSTSDLVNDSGFLDSSDFKTINNESIVGSGNINIQGGGVSVESLTQAEYDELTPAQKSGDTIWIITDVNPGGGGAAYSAGTNIDITNNVISVTGISVPTDVSDLNNDAGYVTQSELPTDVSDLNNDAGYLTSSDLKTINYQSIVGSGNINIQGGGGGGGISVVEISQEDYDELPASAKTDTSVIFVISGATSNYYTKSEVNALMPTKTSDLVNDSNFLTAVKTINYNTMDGSGNLSLKSVASQSIVGSGDIPFKTINNQSIQGSGNFVLPTFTYDSTTQTLNITTT